MIYLRPHHLLCLCLFEGRGYNGKFSENMKRILGLLAHKNSELFTLVSGRDDICAACPNSTANKTCSLGESDVLRKDRFMMDLLGLRYHGRYVFLDIVRRLRASVTPESFEICCESCRWHAQGLCTYQKLAGRLLTGETPPACGILP